MSNELDTKLFNIYKIVCKDLNIKSVYVGSTINFIRREKEHKSNCGNEKGKEYNCKLYKTIRENGNWDNWEAYIIHTEPYTNKQNKLITERSYIDSLCADLNTNKSYRTIDEITNQNKNYYECNKETICKERTYYYKRNKDAKSKLHRDYYNYNKDAIKKTRIERNRKNKVTCECGRTHLKVYNAKHIKTNYHQAYINTAILCRTEVE